MQVSLTKFEEIDGLTPLRRARIQHNILSCMENGAITKGYAAQRLTARLGMTFENAQAIVDGDA